VIKQKEPIAIASGSAVAIEIGSLFWTVSGGPVS
jgi:hypothetical protein